jgi:hypothetical protein
MAMVAGVLNKHAARLLRLPGVLGAAVGFRRRKGQIEDEPVITVFVERGLKRRRLADVPRSHRIPREVRVRLSGGLRAVPIDLVPSRRGRVYRRSEAKVAPGEPVANQASPSNVGTLGWVARLDGPEPEPVVCGACHVLLRLRESNFVGDRDKTFVFSLDHPEFIAIPPTGANTPVTGFVIAGRRGGPLDAAVAILDNARPTRQIPGLGRMGSLRTFTPDDLEFPSGPRVFMRAGRGVLLEGEVTRYPARVTFGYSDVPDGLIIEDLIETDLTTQPGDSGGLLVDADIRPLGMLLGAAGGRSYFVHLKNVASEFGLTDL